MSQRSKQLHEADRERGATLFLRARQTNHPGDARLLEQWIGDDAVRRDLVESLAQVWNGIGDVSADPRVAGWRAEAAAAVSAPVRQHARPGARAVLAMAASLVLALMAGVAILAQAPWRPQVPEQRFATAIGERKWVKLADGSAVLLDAGSRLIVDYAPDERTVRLASGQARFHVAHDPDRPFHVEVAGDDVRALGTEFNVAITGAKPSVSLIDGSVLVSRIQERSVLFGLRRVETTRPIATLRPGQQLNYDADGRPLLRRFDPEVVNAWRNGRIIFENMPIADAALIVNRYSRRPVMVDPHLSARRMTGVFNAGDGLAFAQAAANYLPGARLDVSDQRIVIRDGNDFSTVDR